MKVNRIDHIVLTVNSLERSIAFYSDVLGMEKEAFGDNRVALLFGHQKINLHQFQNEFLPKASLPIPGSEDLCFITETNLAEALEFVKSKGVDIIEGPVKRTGATGEIESFYIRDPDGNLIELSSYSTDPLSTF